mmetsp:Transcript_20200/g.56025  ORF Transcript_20200/g.56025 Transcript_20200/m.56025 type:complete len:177 (+) Transcript_20200:147-677(+)
MFRLHLAAFLGPLLLLCEQWGAAGARELQGMKNWDPWLKTCTVKLPNAKKGCDYECPKNSCVKAGKSCVKDFTDCECEPGHHKPRPSRFTTPKMPIAGSGTKEGRRVHGTVAKLVSGESGYCVASHGRAQFGPTYDNKKRLHSKAPYLPQTFFTAKGQKKRLAPVPNPAFRPWARS